MHYDDPLLTAGELLAALPWDATPIRPTIRSLVTLRDGRQIRVTDLMSSRREDNSAELAVVGLEVSDRQAESRTLMVFANEVAQVQ